MNRQLFAALLSVCSLATAAPATLRDPRVDAARQTFTPAQQRILDALATRIQARPAAVPALQWRGGGLDGGAAWLSFSAPFRTRTPEGWTYFRWGRRKVSTSCWS